jgi:hypothetical protein
VQRRFLLPSLAAIAVIAAACGEDEDSVSCEIVIGDERSTATFGAAEGESAEATIGGYLFTFTVLPGARVQALVTNDADEFVFESEFDVDGGSGSMPAEDAGMSYSCS